MKLSECAYLAVLMLLAFCFANDQHSQTVSSGTRYGLVAPAQGSGVIKTQISTMKIPDVEMTDQDGRKVQLYSDLIKGKVVVLNFFFTSCVNVCLTQGVTLKKLKSHLAERFGKEIFFVSISKNPKTDTPAKLKHWGKQFGVGPGWSLVTGDLKVIDELSLSLTAEEAGSAAHSPILIIGNDTTGVWSLASGDASTSELTEVIERVSGSVVRSQR